MGVSAGFREFVLEQMQRVSPVTLRRMFGGIGIYAQGVFFALIDDDTLFFKVDEVNRDDFIAAGMEPFRPFRDERRSLQYYELPTEVLDDVEALREWMAKSVGAARRGKSVRQKPVGRKAARKTGASRPPAATRRGKGKVRRRARAINK